MGFVVAFGGFWWPLLAFDAFWGPPVTFGDSSCASPCDFDPAFGIDDAAGGGIGSRLTAGGGIGSRWTAMGCEIRKTEGYPQRRRLIGTSPNGLWVVGVVRGATRLDGGCGGFRFSPLVRALLDSRWGGASVHCVG